MTARHPKCTQGSVLDRRRFCTGLLGLPLGALAGCGPDPDYYTAEDAAELEAHKRRERERSGQGPFGAQFYPGYRGLAELPWFEWREGRGLRCVDEGLPSVIDFHAHLGMSLLLAPELDLQARSERVRYLLDLDADPEAPESLDLDVYANANFSKAALRRLRFELLSQALWGGGAAATHTIPNLLGEMDAMRVARAVLHPIAFGLPFGDDLAERWSDAVEEAGAGDRLHVGGSVHPRDEARLEKLRAQAAHGSRVVKLHPAAQRFFPDAPEAMELYRECARLGLVVFFHGGRAGIEPSSQHPYTLMEHYEPALERFPELPFVLGHAGARDVADALPLAERHPNCWLGIHGQGVSVLASILERLGPERLLFGSDWPFYPLAMSLAKVLLVTRDRPDARAAILSGNAERLLGERSVALASADRAAAPTLTTS